MKKAILYLFLGLFTAVIITAQEDTTRVDTLQFPKDVWGVIDKVDSIRNVDVVQKELLREEFDGLLDHQQIEYENLERQLFEITEQDKENELFIKNKIDSLKGVLPAFPIAPYNDTLFNIYTPNGVLNPSERASIIKSRLLELYEEKHFNPEKDTLQIVVHGKMLDLVYHDKTVVSVTNYDAIWQGKTKKAIVLAYKTKIDEDLLKYRKGNMLTIIGKAILIIVLQIILIKLVRLFFKREVDVFLVSQKGKFFRGITIKDYEFLDAERETQLFLFMSRLLRLFINGIQLYITIPFVLSFFVLTQGLAEKLFGFILSPTKQIATSFIAYLPNLWVILVILVITKYFIKLLKFLSREIENGKLKITGFYADWARPTFNIIRFLTLAFMFVVIFPYLPGSNSPVFQGVSVFLGIMFSLGSSSVIGNMIAGLVMTYMRPFQLGDRIKVVDITGDVVEKTPFVIRVKTIKNEFVTIPNSNILASNITNYSTSKANEGIVLYTTVTIGYDVPWKKVHKLLINAAKETPRVLKIPSPFVLQTSLDDFYMSYQLNVYTNEPNEQAITYSHLHQNIQDCFNKNDVEILSPHYRAQRDGNMITIPTNYLPPDYKVPKFRVETSTKGKTEK